MVARGARLVPAVPHREAKPKGVGLQEAIFMLLGALANKAASHASLRQSLLQSSASAASAGSPLLENAQFVASSTELIRRQPDLPVASISLATLPIANALGNKSRMNRNKQLVVSKRMPGATPHKPVNFEQLKKPDGILFTSRKIDMLLSSSAGRMMANPRSFNSRLPRSARDGGICHVKGICIYTYVCVCVCVREREREREG